MARQLAVALTGAPGAGKTSTAAELARLLGAALLDLDTLTNPMVDALAASLGDAAYDDDRVGPALREARYACLTGAALDCLRVGRPVVLVAPFTRERSDAQAWAGLAHQLSDGGGEPHLAWLRITAEQLGARLRSRQAERDRAKLADLAAWLGSVDLSAPQVRHLEVDAAGSPQEQAAALLDQLRRPSA